MKRVGSSVVFFLFVTFSSAFAQTGNNWKIMIQKPMQDKYWSSVGLTKSEVPRFPGASASPTTQGSCVVIEPNLVLTVAHAVRSTRFDVELGGHLLKGSLIAMDPLYDRALVKLDTEYPGPVCKLRKTPLKEGEKLKSYGFGRGYGYHNVEFKNKLFYGDAYFGDSGGPILDENDEVVGVTCSTSKDTVANMTNIFSYGYEDLYKWVQENKDGTVESPKLTVSKRN